MRDGEGTYLGSRVTRMLPLKRDEDCAVLDADEIESAWTHGR